MNHSATLFLVILSFYFSVLSTEAGEYSGAVGKLKAKFSLDFHNNGSVSGTYSYPSRKGTVYRLSGSNPRQGELYLEEFTGRSLSAKCYLSKRISKGSIIWEGVMKNTDGRQFKIYFARESDAGANLRPVAKAKAGENRYTGNVGKLAAEYFLKWGDNGGVSGTYHYPARRGVTYRLEGSNPRAGVLLLNEYTGSKLSAKCTLEKRITNGSIVWEGTMKNTDGRQFQMSLARQRDATPPSAAPAGNFEAPDWFSRVKPQEHWDSLPKANDQVEKVPIRFPNSVSANAKVTRYVSTRDKIEIDYVLGVRNKKRFQEIQFTGPKVSFRAPRGLELPGAEVAGKEIFLEYDQNGNLLALGLHAIAVTHVRKSPSGKLEIRGILSTNEVANLHDANFTKMRDVIERTPSVTFVPDKLALLKNFPADELYFRALRIVRDYGVCIQATAAGPGALELEAISFDSPENEVPWVFLGGKAGWNMIPLSQRTGEAG